MRKLLHFDRIHTDCKPVLSFTPRPTKRQRRVSSLNEDTKRIVTNTEMVTIDRAEEMSVYRCSDFALENLLAIGAPLNPATLSASPHKAVADMEAVLSNLETPTE